MSEKMTRIRLRHSRYGRMDYGEQTFEEMVRQIRSYAEALKEEADAILAADQSAFDVDIVRGPWAQHFVRSVSPQEVEKS